MLTLLGKASEEVVATFRRRHAARAAQREAENAEATTVDGSEGGGGAGDEGVHTGASRSNDACMLALMLDAGCTDSEAAAVVVNTVIAGAEAPASALAHTLLELGRNRVEQDKVRAEVMDVAGPVGAPSEHLSNLPYVKSTVLEGLRLYAPATLVKRQALVDAEVDGVGKVPKGTVVELCVTAIHADPNQFADPMAFRPNREGPVVAAILGKERCFMPFSGGLRGCPGRYLAVTMLHTALASIVQRFHIEADPSAPDHTVATGELDEAARVRKFALWPKAGLPIKLTPVTATGKSAAAAAEAPVVSAPLPEVAADKGEARPAHTGSDARRWAKQGMAPPSLWRASRGPHCDVWGDDLPSRGTVPKASSRDELPRIPKSHSRDGCHDLPGVSPFTGSRDGSLPRIPFSNSRDGNLPVAPCEGRVARE